MRANPVDHSMIHPAFVRRPTPNDVVAVRRLYQIVWCHIRQTGKHSFESGNTMINMVPTGLFTPTERGQVAVVPMVSVDELPDQILHHVS